MLVGSLEAIFLSTFVMVGQNRQAALQQAKADRNYASVGPVAEGNTRLIPQRTREVHQVVTQPQGAGHDS